MGHAGRRRSDGNACRCCVLNVGESKVVILKCVLKCVAIFLLRRVGSMDQTRQSILVRVKNGVICFSNVGRFEWGVCLQINMASLVLFFLCSVRKRIAFVGWFY